MANTNINNQTVSQSAINITNDADNVTITDSSLTAISSFEVNMLGGDDIISITNSSIDPALELGQGNDQLIITDSQVGFDTTVAELVNALDGDDTLSVTNSTLLGRVWMGLGNDQAVVSGSRVDDAIQNLNGTLDVTITNSTVSGALSGFGTGTDTFSINNGSIAGAIQGFSDADTIIVNGGSTVDGSAEGGDGNDDITVTGGANVNAISAGANDDEVLISGASTVGNTDLGDGADTLTITGSSVTGFVSGGGGNDNITIEDATVDGDISLGDGTDFLSVDADSSLGNANIAGEGGNDTINLSTYTLNAVSIDGGAGADSLIGSTQGDTLTGGADNDVMTGGAGGDVFTETSGDGADTITDFDFTTNISADPSDAGADTTDNDFVDLAAFYDQTALDAYNAAAPGNGDSTLANAIGLMRADAADGRLDYSINGNDYSGVMANDIDLSINNLAANADNLFFENTNVVCFTEGTHITTADGPVAVQDLAVGDLVETADNGLQPIRWTGTRRFTRAEIAEHPGLAPVMIKAGALGRSLPERDLIVSQQHRMFVNSKMARNMFGSAEVLVAAKQLVALEGVDILRDADEVTYVHFLCDGHELVYAEGAASESLYTGPEALKSLPVAARQEIFAIFPELLHHAASGTLPQPVRKLVKGRDGRRMAQRMKKSRRLPLEIRT